MADDPPTISILLLGDSGVGKSTFLSSLSGKFDGSHGDPKLLRDIDQPFVYDIRQYNRPYRFEFSDTASPENYTLLRPDVITLCYDISCPTSLESIQERWSRIILSRYLYNNDSIPVLLLGLKRDLRTESSNETIHPEHGMRIAQQLRCDRYMECSAVTTELMREVFEDIAKSATKTTTENGGKSEGGCEVM